MGLRACDELDHLTVHVDQDVLEFVAKLAFLNSLHEFDGTRFEQELWPFP